MKIRSLIATVLTAFLLFPLSGASQHNPYLDKKKKNKPSVKQRREDARALKAQKKAARKQMRKTRRAILRDNNRKAKGKVRGR
jgi:hypothetical protein